MKVRFYTFAVCLMTLLIHSACSLQGVDLYSKKQPQGADEPPPGSPARANITAGMGNFRQIYENYLSTTGVSPTTAIPDSGGQTMQTLYANQKSILPTRGLTSEASTPVFFTTAVMAANACRLLINNDAASIDANRRAFKSVNFTNSGTSAQLRGAAGDALLQQVGNQLFNLFQGRDMAPEEYSSLLEARTEALLDVIADNTAQRNNVLLIICGAVGGSIGSLTI